MSQHIDAVAKQSGLDALNSKIRDGSDGSINLNDYITTGMYAFNGKTSTNAPSSGISTLIVQRYSNDWISQMVTVITANGSEVYVRDYHDGTTWSSWEKLALNSNMTYNSGDVFSMRSFHTSGRVINSGKGIFCWLDLAKPCTATGASFEFGNTINVFGIDSATPTRTVSTIIISGNQLSFVIDLSSSHTPGETAIVEFEAKITLT